MAKKRNKDKNRQKNGEGSQQQPRSEITKDPKFSVTVKQLYRSIQLIHHLQIMKAQKEGEVVKSFRQKSNELANFIKPAVPDSEITKVLAEVAHTWVSGTTEALINHYTKAKSAIGLKLKMHSFCDEELQKAKSLALSWAKKNFGKKLRNSSIEEYEKLCSDLKPQVINDDSVQDPSTSRSMANVVASSVDTPRTPKRSRARVVSLSPNREGDSPPGKVPNTQGTPPPAVAPSLGASPTTITDQTPPRPKPAEVRFPAKKRSNFKPFKADKRDWKLPDITAKTVMLGDSNLANITKARVSQGEVQVCSFPGAKFFSMRGFLARVMTKYDKVERLVLSLGINERDNLAETTCKPSLRRLLKEIKRVFPAAKIFMATIQWNSKKVTDAQNNNLVALNEMIGKCEDLEIIPGLNPSLFKINPEDKYGIHWTKETANEMLDSWLDNLN